MKQSEYNLLKSRRNPENPFEKGQQLTIYNTPQISDMKKDYHSVISQYLKEQNFEFNVVADLGCGLPFATLPFAQQDNKTLCCLDGYIETHKRYYFSKQELDNFFAVQSGDVTFYNLDSDFKMPKADVWISIMAVGKYIDPALHKNLINEFSNKNTKIIFVVYKNNWRTSIEVKNIIANKERLLDLKMGSNVKDLRLEFDNELILAEVEFTDDSRQG